MKTNTLKLVKMVPFTLAAAMAAVTFTGCYTPQGQPDNTATGALGGAAFGAATGAIIGSASHSAGEGALIGAGAGTLLGALIGHSADQAQQARDAQLRAQAPATYQRAAAGAPLSLADVKALSKAGINDDTIIAQINNSHTIFHLNANDIIDLSQTGVSQKVIDFMINSPNTVTPAATMVTVTDAPPPAPVLVAPPIPGPGYVWVDGEWVWNHGWYWSAGYWAFPPSPGFVWIGGYWGRGPHGYVRYGGHWGRR